MTAEAAGRCELTQFVSYHVFGHIDGDEFVPVVYRQGMAHEVRRDHAGTRPGLDYLCLAVFGHVVTLVFDFLLYIRSVFN